MKEDTSQERFAELLRALESEHAKIEAIKGEFASRSTAIDLAAFGHALAELEEAPVLRALHATAPTPLSFRV